LLNISGGLCIPCASKSCLACLNSDTDLNGF
jgi:hypothetical protein